MSLPPVRQAEPGSTMEPQLPATRDEGPLALAADDHAQPTEWRSPVSVAYLPLALATFVLIAFVMAMWTFLAATG